jgi:Fe-S-cluster containining protein
MAFCARCPASKNCCTRVAHRSKIENPFVFGDEVSDLEMASGQVAEQFLEPRSTASGRTYQALKATAGGCTFFQEGLCQAYSDRPLDCRLFPFDIKRDGADQFVWIVYTALCPVNFNIDENFAATRTMLEGSQLSSEELSAYVDSDARGMALQDCQRLGPVRIVARAHAELA